MPKGQYNRRPKAPGQVLGRAEHVAELRSVMPSGAVPVEPTGGVVIGDTVHPPLAEKTFVEPDAGRIMNDPVAALALAATRIGAEMGAVVVLSHNQDRNELRGDVAWPSGKIHGVTVPVPVTPSWIEMNAAIAEVQSTASEQYLRLHQPVTSGPSFDAWLDEDTSPIPANDRVSQMVQEWATGFIPVEHSVAWLPAKDGKALSVLLTTAHGTSELVADAGAWTEADVSAALAVMRDELKV